MASGAPVLQIIAVTPTVTSGAIWDTLVGTSAPAEALNVWAFPDAAAAYLDVSAILKGYGGGGLTITLVWATTVTANNCVWQVAVRRVADDAEDLDTTAQTYDYNTVTAAAPSAAGEVSYDDVVFTSGADMDNLADGELCVLRILRDPAHASDTLGATASLLGLIGRET